MDRKTARRYVAAAEGLSREAGVEALSDELVGAVVAALRPARPNGHGASWDLLLAREEQIKQWVAVGDGWPPLSIMKIEELLTRQGCVVPYRTLHRFAVERCGLRTKTTTMRIVDGEPGVECQIDFMPLAGRVLILLGHVAVVGVGLGPLAEAAASCCHPWSARVIAAADRPRLVPRNCSRAATIALIGSPRCDK